MGRLNWKSLLLMFALPLLAPIVLVAQEVAAQTDAAGGAHGDATNILAAQGVTVVLIPFFVRYLKKANWVTWINDHTDGLNRAIAWTLGVVAAAGVHWTTEWQGQQFHFMLDLTNFTFGALWHSALVVAGQLGGQQFVYNGLKTIDLLQAVLKTLHANAGLPTPGGK